MKYKISILLILAILSVCRISKCQTPSLNLDKYWTYRSNFFDKFILDIDPNSLPSGASIHGINIASGVYDANKVKWGDSGVKQGYYIAAMATEYKLQKMLDHPTAVAKSKIYRAMNAINRLDSYAEPFYGGGVSGDPPCSTKTNINGFFMRDDVYEDFIDDWVLQGKTSWANKEVQSDYTHHKGIYYNEMSQDQVIGLMMGLALVKHFVNSVETYEDLPCEYVTLREMAQRQTYRSINFMQTYTANPWWKWHDFGHSDYPGEWKREVPFAPQAWKVINPCTRGVVERGGGWTDLYLHQPHFEDAGNWLTEQIWGDMHYNNPCPLLPPFDPNPILDLPITIGNDHYYNQIMKLTLTTIANNHYASDLDELFWNIRKCADYYNDNVPGNPFETKYFIWDHLPMISILLHGKDPASSELFDFYYSHIEQLLNEAPAGGLQNWVYPPSKPIWSMPSMFETPFGEYISCENSDCQRLGEYNSLDYMILFNLYHLIYQTCFNDPVTITNDFPTTYTYDEYDFLHGVSTIPIGYQINDAFHTIHSKDLIMMNSAIQSNGKLRLRGDKIILQPGFKVELGGEFIAEPINVLDLDFTPPTGNYKSSKKDTSNIPPPQYINEEIKEIEITSESVEIISNVEFQVFPNPTEDIAMLKCSGIKSDLNQVIRIIDVNGKVVWKRQLFIGEGEISVDLTEYGSGVYFCILESNGKRISKRILIVK